MWTFDSSTWIVHGGSSHKSESTEPLNFCFYMGEPPSPSVARPFLDDFEGNNEASEAWFWVDHFSTRFDYDSPAYSFLEARAWLCAAHFDLDD